VLDQSGAATGTVVTSRPDDGRPLPPAPNVSRAHASPYGSSSPHGCSSPAGSPSLVTLAGPLPSALPHDSGLTVSWTGGLAIGDVLAAAQRYGLHRASLTLPAWPEADGTGDDLAVAGLAPSQDGDEAFQAAVAGRGRVLPAGALAGHAVMAPGPDLAGWLSCAAPGELDDAALTTSITAWRKLTSWAQAQELTAIAELARRRGAAGPGDADETASADADTGRAEADPVARLEAEFTPSEVALALTLTQTGAEIWTDLAVSLSGRLPATLAALRSGKIDLNRARLIDHYTCTLDAGLAQAVERRVLGRAERQTTGQLRASLQRAVLAADPAAAERRRMETERDAWVGLSGDEDGTASLCGRFLPAAQAAAAWARICAMAKAMEAAGYGGGMDLLRAQVFVGLLLGTLPLIPPSDGEPGDPGPDGTGPPSDGEPGDPGPDGTGRSGSGRNRGPRGGSPSGPSGNGSGRSRGGPSESGPASSGGGARGHDSGHDGEPWAGADQPRDDDAPADENAWSVAPLLDQDPQVDRDPLDDHDPLIDESHARGDPSGAESHRGAVQAGLGHDPRPPPAWPPLPRPGAPPSPGCVGLARAGPQRQAVGFGWPSAEGGTSTGRAALSVSWRTLAGLLGEPGHLGRIGPITAAVARDLALAAASDVTCAWNVIVVSDRGQAIAVTKIRREDWASAGGRIPAHAGHTPEPGVVGRVTVTIPIGLAGSVGLAGPADAAGPVGLAASTGPGPIGLLVSTGPGPAGPAGPVGFPGCVGTAGPGGLLIPLTPTERGPLAVMLWAALTAASRACAAGSSAATEETCGHQGASPAYHVPDRIRALVEARDRTCRFPICRQPAGRCEQDHTIPYRLGGATCPCNLTPECKRHHRLKHLPGWRLDQPRPGILIWTTPAGISHTVQADPYPG
jgi:hypothetical protein